jgi:hypothetical protein
MSKHRDIERKWIIDYMTPAIGCTIVEVGVGEDEEGEQGFPYLKLRRPATKTAEAEEFTLEVSQDEEGNGPGHLFGLPSPGSSVTTIKLKNGLRVLAYDDGKPKRFSRADAQKELKEVRGMGHNAQIRKAQPSGNHYIAILEDDEEGGDE